MILYITIGVTMGYFLSHGDKYKVVMGSTGIYDLTTIVVVLSLLLGALYTIAKYNEINREYTKMLVNFSSGIYITLLAGAIRSEFLSQDVIYKMGKMVLIRKFSNNERYEIVNQVWHSKEAMTRPLQQPVKLLKEVSENTADFPTISSMKARVHEIFEENLVIQMTSSSKGSLWIYIELLQGYMIANPYISAGVGLLLTAGIKYLWSSFGSFGSYGSSVSYGKFKEHAQTTDLVQKNLIKLSERVDMLEKKHSVEILKANNLISKLTSDSESHGNNLSNLARIVTQLSYMVQNDLVPRVSGLEIDLSDLKDLLEIIAGKVGFNIEVSREVSEKFAPFKGTGFKLGDSNDNSPVIIKKADKGENE